MFKKIVIFGVGLIGGSFALALKKAGAVECIVGFDRSPVALARALQLGIIDAMGEIVDDELKDAELVMLAVPVAQTAALLHTIAPHLQVGTVVTDCGSTKADTATAARAALAHKISQFVPGHPIAGREQNGPDAALADLYINKKVVLTPLPENSAHTIERVASAWQYCGARVCQLSAEQHDAVFATVSHLPHLLAYALVDDIANRPEAGLLFDYAASGFRDFTRIAASSPEMWRDIALANQAALLTELDAYQAQLQRLRAALVAGDGATLEAMFANARQARVNWAKTIESNPSLNRRAGD